MLFRNYKTVQNCGQAAVDGCQMASVLLAANSNFRHFVTIEKAYSKLVVSVEG